MTAVEGDAPPPDPAPPGLFVGVVGPAVASGSLVTAAEEVGRLVAVHGATLVCGGTGGVMAAACRGAYSAGGSTVGLLPGLDRSEANPWVTVALPTGLGELRNGLVVRGSDVLVSVGGEYGTLSEVALALKTGIPVVGLGTWSLTRPDGRTDEGIVPAASPDEAVRQARRLAAGAR